MPIITNYPITLDVQEVLSQVSIPVPQDKARRISATLTENGSPLYLPDGCRAVFSATKADGTTVNNDCIIEHNTVVRYDFTEQTTAAVGKVECCFKVYGLEGEYLYGPIFTLVVYENKAGDIIFSEDEKNFLDRIFAAEESRISAEILRDDAERARGKAEAVRAAAEQERVTAENARKTALVDNLTTDDPGKYLSARMGKKLNEDKVPTTRTVNKKPLSSDIDLNASDVGAAPAGFGLGEERSKEIYDANNIDLPGFYQSKANTPDESQYWFILHSKHHKNYSHKKQLAFSVQSGHICVRSCHTDWQPWEYVNPPMRVGVEYRTTERWMGKSVYTKLIDCGACPAVGDVKEIGHGVGSYSSIISFNGHLSSGDALPYINYRGTTGTANDIVSQVNLSVTPTNVKLATIKWGISSPEVTSLTATVQIKYTKG